MAETVKDPQICPEIFCFVPTAATCSCEISSCKLTMRLLSETGLKIVVREVKLLAANIKNKKS